MKIAMVHTMYAPRMLGGAERLLKLLCEGLVKMGHEVHVIASAPNRGERELNGVHVHEVGLFNLYWPYGSNGAPKVLEAPWHVIDLRNPVMAARAAKTISTIVPDVVHTHGLVGFSTLVWRDVDKLRMPLVHTIHDHRLHCVRAAMFKRGRPCLEHCLSCRVTAPLKQTYAPVIDVVVAVSQAVLDEHRQMGFFERSEHRIIPVPVHLGNAMRSRVRSAADPVRFGSLGRLHPGKGIDLLLDATTALPDSGWELLIAGEGERGFAQQLHARDRGNGVRFVGPVESRSFLADLDVLVMPSQLNESAGLVIAEAFAAGVPVLAARRGGMSEMVDDGKTGHLFDPDDAAAIVDAMVRAIAEPLALAAMADGCFAAAERHGVSRVVAAYESAYAQAIERRGSRLTTR